MVKKLTPAQRKALVKTLSTKPVSSVSYRNGHIMLKFDGHKLRNKVVVKHDPGMGDWSRVRREVHYDEKIKGEDIMPVLVHETIEKYVSEKYHLNLDKESHKVATRIEKRFISMACSRKYKNKCTHSGRCWRLHEARIQRIWLKENARVLEMNKKLAKAKKKNQN